MQEALPYKRWDALLPMSVASASTICGGNDNETGVLTKFMNVVKENPVVVFGRSGCCMCQVVRNLMLGLGVNPPLFEIDVDVNESLLLNSLYSNMVLGNEESKVSVSRLQFPLVFVGGKLFGGLDKVMATHLSGDLVPILKQARALWL